MSDGAAMLERCFAMQAVGSSLIHIHPTLVPTLPNDWDLDAPHDHTVPMAVDPTDTSGPNLVVCSGHRHDVILRLKWDLVPVYPGGPR